MSTAYIRFFEELNDFLPKERWKKEFPVEFFDGETVKAVIENLGVPHTEIDLITVNSDSVPFEYKPSDGDAIRVYPVFEGFDVRSLSKVRPVPLRRTAFILDVHLGKLARILRMLGLDSSYGAPFDDDSLSRRSVEDHRILLTRDRGLLMRRIVTHGYLVRSEDPEEQASEVLSRFDLAESIHTFTRCMSCNGLLETREKETVFDRLPPKVRSLEEFKECTACGKLYWKGTHWERMTERIRRLTGNADA